MLRSNIAAALAAVVLAGCGGREAAPGTRAAADLTAVQCPVAQDGPAENAFDTAVLVGRPLDAARAQAARHGCVLEIAKEDGRGLPVSIDFAPERIYVYVERGTVSHIEGVGGGI